MTIGVGNISHNDELRRQRRPEVSSGLPTAQLPWLEATALWI